MPVGCIILDQSDVLATLFGIRVSGAVPQPAICSALIGTFVYITQHVCGTPWQSTSTRLHGFGRDSRRDRRRKADFNVTSQTPYEVGR
jgi:hypothetical protein